MSDIIQVKQSWKQKTKCTNEQYQTMYNESISDPNDFWAKHGKRLHWDRPYTKVKNVSFDPQNLYIKWYEDGCLNASYNCVDRHLEKNADKIAFIFEGDSPEDTKKYTYQDVYFEVCRFANVLKELGVQKGDRVSIYMPMIPEGIFAMLSCARIGAVHSVIFGGFSPKSLASRIEDCGAKIVITTDEAYRGGKIIPLKSNTDEALKDVKVDNVLVIKRTGNSVNMQKGRDIWYHEVAATVSNHCDYEIMNAEDPLFILYTSGSTGKPKGLLHTTGGYLVYASMTHEYVFDIQPDDIYWCTADIGWITGHSYIVYGAMANATTSVIFEGVPTYPTVSRMWEVVDKHQVTILYTAPTAIRALMRLGDDNVSKTSRKSLRLLGSVGEPINPEAWQWYYKIVGDERCAIVDTWWQTETGGVLISPLPGAIDLKPGSATLPFFGIRPALVNNEGKIIEGEAEGNLVVIDSFPSQARSIYGDHNRFIDTYFKQFPFMYTTGDGAKRDADGYYWITGRVDDVINVSGHRLGTAEIESALVAHNSVSEAAVVGFPHNIKGQGIYAYVSLMENVSFNEQLKKDLIQWVREHIGAIATPDVIHFTNALPKTRSGKIMRRILRKIAAGEFEDFGDTSTLADPDCIQNLIETRKKAA